MNKKFTTAFIFMASLFSLQIQAQEFEQKLLRTWAWAGT